MLHLNGTGPLYQQICRSFRNEIVSRAIASAERVPSTRALADLLKVSRNTAVMAYEQLIAEGYLEARMGAAGTVVAWIFHDKTGRHPTEPTNVGVLTWCANNPFCVI